LNHAVKTASHFLAKFSPFIKLAAVNLPRVSMSKRLIYYDTETTGVRSDRDRIIEIAAYDPTHDRSFVHFVHPGFPIPPEATAIHKITDAMVADAPSFAEVGKLFADFCSGDVVLIAHNNDAFDKLFLQSEYARHGLTVPDWGYLDSLKWARRYRPDLPRHSLQALREAYGIEANQAHRALDDVKILHQVFSLMIDDLPLETVLSLINRPNMPLTNMPFGKYQGKPLQEVPRDYLQWLNSSGALQKAENNELKNSLERLGLLSTAGAPA
jgi:DNA polymerase III subunit epsilon